MEFYVLYGQPPWHRAKRERKQAKCRNVSTVSHNLSTKGACPGCPKGHMKPGPVAGFGEGTRRLYFFSGWCFYRAALGAQQKWAEDTEISLICPVHTCVQPLVLSTSPCQSGTAVTTDEPVLTHLYYLEFRVYITVHSWWCTFYRLGQMHMDVCHHYAVIQSRFTVPKFLCVLPFSLPSNPWQPLTLCCSIVFGGWLFTLHYLCLFNLNHSNDYI